jgi:hypothetical protein
MTMSAIIKNIQAPSVASPVMLGIDTGKKTSANTIYKSYTTTASKKWYRQSTAKRISMDWDMNQNELEFE